MGARGKAAGATVDLDSRRTQVPHPTQLLSLLKSKHDSGLANWDAMSAWASGSLRSGGSCSGRQLPGAPVTVTCWPHRKLHLGTAPPAGGGEALGSSDCCQATEVFRVRQPSLSFHKVPEQFVNKAYLRRIRLLRKHEIRLSVFASLLPSLPPRYYGFEITA